MSATHETIGDPVVPDALEFTKRTRRTLRSIRAWAQRLYEKAHADMVDAQADSLHSHRDDMEKATARKRAAAAEERMVRWGMYVEALDEVLASQPSDQDPTLFDHTESTDGEEPQPEQEEATGAEGEGAGDIIDYEYEVTGATENTAADAGADRAEAGEPDGAAGARPVQAGGGEAGAGPEGRGDAQSEGGA